MAEVVTRERGKTAAADEPIYLRVRRTVLDRITTGVYPVGSMMPSENELAQEFNTTRLTIRAAIDALVERGMVRRVQGKGAFVAGPVTGVACRHRGFRGSTRSDCAEPTVRVLSQSVREAGPYYAYIFGIEPDDLLYVVRRLNSVDGKPVAIERTMIPLALFPGIEDVDISVFSLYETYEMLGHRVALAQEKLDIEALGARDAALLDTEPGDLVLSLECISYHDDMRPIEYAISYNRGDRGAYTYKY